MKDHSQWGQANVLKELFDIIGTKHKFAVEFGAADGHWLSNIRGFIDIGWTGLQMDGYPGRTGETLKDHYGRDIEGVTIRDPGNVKQEFITAENINKVFAKYKTPHDFDLLVIDVDGMDYWLWHALKYQPSVVMVEYNPNFHSHESVALKYQADYIFKYDWAHSASLRAFENLATKKGYFLYHEIDNSDLIFVRNDFKDKAQTLTDPDLERLKHLNMIRKRGPYSPHWGKFGDPAKIRAQFVEVD